MKKENKHNFYIKKYRGKYHLLTIVPTKPNHLIIILSGNLNSKVLQAVVVSIKKFYPRYRSI